MLIHFPPVTPCTLTPAQKAFYVQKFRPLAFVLENAVEIGEQKEFLARVRAVNGELASEAQEVVKPSLFKDYGTGLNTDDVQAFVRWFVGPSESMVNKRVYIQQQLQFLKHRRLAIFHIYYQDGRVPETLRM